MTIITSGFTVAIKHSNGFTLPLTRDNNVNDMMSHLSVSQIETLNNGGIVTLTATQEILISLSVYQF